MTEIITLLNYSRIDYYLPKRKLFITRHTVSLKLYQTVSLCRDSPREGYFTVSLNIIRQSRESSLIDALISAGFTSLRANNFSENITTLVAVPTPMSEAPHKENVENIIRLVTGGGGLPIK